MEIKLTKQEKDDIIKETKKYAKEEIQNLVDETLKRNIQFTIDKIKEQLNSHYLINLVDETVKIKIKQYFEEGNLENKIEKKVTNIVLQKLDYFDKRILSLYQKMDNIDIKLLSWKIDLKNKI
jgi:predicted RNA-binding protein Jag